MSQRVNAILAVAAVTTLSFALATPVAFAQPMSGPWRDVPSGTKVTFDFGMVRDDSAAQAKLYELANPASATYRQWMDEKAIAQAYGATAATKQAVKSWFTKHGYTVTFDASGVLVHVTGTAKKWNKTFNTSLKMELSDTQYDLDGTSILAKKKPKMPTSLAGLIAEAPWFTQVSRHIKGAIGAGTATDNPVPAGAPQNAGTWVGACTKAAMNGQNYAFGQVQTAYGLTDPGAIRVGVVTFGEGVTKRSVNAAEKCWGWPHQDIERVKTYGQTKYPKLMSNEQFSESQLDAQMIRGFAPNATVVNYQGWVNFSTWYQPLAVAFADAKRPNVLSVSFGECESLVESDPGRPLMDAMALRLGLAGTTLITASGDSGSAGCNGLEEVSYPASSPFFLTVGGTRLVLDPNNARSNEVTWNDFEWLSANDGGGATGGGVSSLYSKLPWQISSNITSVAGRAVPDIAAHASRLPGWPIVLRAKNAKGKFTNKWAVNSGTSAAAPLTAVMLESKNVTMEPTKPMGFAGPALYGQAASFFDVVSGNNVDPDSGLGGYEALPGYDLVTGLGVPNVGSLK